MREVRASAPGKVNLTLRVGAPTPDGYHPLVTVFEALNLRETVTVRTSKAPGVRVETIAYLPDGSVDEARPVLWRTWIRRPTWPCAPRVSSSASPLQAPGPPRPRA